MDHSRVTPRRARCAERRSSDRRALETRLRPNELLMQPSKQPRSAADIGTGHSPAISRHRPAAPSIDARRINKPAGIPDLTQGSIVRLIVTLGAPTAIGMLTQLAYQLVDLYFVARLGAVATAGVNAAGNAILIVNALTQVLSVGTVALIAQAVGRKDRQDANAVFNQAILLAAGCGVASLAVGFTLARAYLRSVAVDSATIDAGVTFIRWVLPGYALMLPMAAAGAGLRATGVVRPPIAIYTGTLIVNTVLAPVLIAGWGTGVALGVQGAGLATTLSVTLGSLALGGYLIGSRSYVTLWPALMRPQIVQWCRILKVGLPAGGEFALLFLSGAMVYGTIRDFGPTAQAGFGIGSRVLQAVLLPAIAIAFAAAPIVGQNLGAQQSTRVQGVFRTLVFIETALMGAMALLVGLRPQLLVGAFDADAAALSIAAEFLQMMSWTFVAQGIVYACTTMFQGLGNTLPSLLSSAIRFLVLSVGVWGLSRQTSFSLEHLWSLLTGSLVLQALASGFLLRVELKRRVQNPRPLPAAG